MTITLCVTPTAIQTNKKKCDPATHPVLPACANVGHPHEPDCQRQECDKQHTLHRHNGPESLLLHVGNARVAVVGDFGVAGLCEGLVLKLTPCEAVLNDLSLFGFDKQVE